jgi:hypothetical protein
MIIFISSRKSGLFIKRELHVGAIPVWALRKNFMAQKHFCFDDILLEKCVRG